MPRQILSISREPVLCKKEIKLKSLSWDKSYCGSKIVYESFVWSMIKGLKENKNIPDYHFLNDLITIEREYGSYYVYCDQTSFFADTLAEAKESIQKFYRNLWETGKGISFSISPL